MKLCVNVDHVATVREARKICYPDPVQAALLAIKAGAYGITIHLREDRRHIQDHDLKRLRASVASKVNLEMAIAEEIVKIALESGADQVTLVPEKREEITTEGGLDVSALENEVKETVGRFDKKGIPTTLFIDPGIQQVEAAIRTGASGIELNTGRYSECSSAVEAEEEFLHIQAAAKFARESGLLVYAGHGLHYENTKKIASVHEVEELNIGHSIVSRSLFVGIEEAVREMLTVIMAAKP